MLKTAETPRTNFSRSREWRTADANQRGQLLPHADAVQPADIDLLQLEPFAPAPAWLPAPLRPHKEHVVPAPAQFPRHRQRRNHVPARAASGHEKTPAHFGLSPQPHCQALLWGSLASCVPIGNRHARRLPIAAQDAILPHYPACSLTFIRIPSSASVLSSELPP
jgi:hypothetical protein